MVRFFNPFLVLIVLTISDVHGQYFSPINNCRYSFGNIKVPSSAVRPGELIAEVSDIITQSSCRNKDVKKEKGNLWWTLPIPPMEMDGAPDKSSMLNPLQLSAATDKAQGSSRAETGEIQQKLPAQVQNQQQQQTQGASPVQSQLVVSNKDTNNQPISTNKSAAAVRASGKVASSSNQHLPGKQRQALFDRVMVDPVDFQYPQESLPASQGGNIRLNNPFYNTYYRDSQAAAKRLCRSNQFSDNPESVNDRSFFRDFDNNNIEIGGGDFFGEIGESDKQPNLNEEWYQKSLEIAEQAEPSLQSQNNRKKRSLEDNKLTFEIKKLS